MPAQLSVDAHRAQHSAHIECLVDRILIGDVGGDELGALAQFGDGFLTP